ncbi:MAG: ketosteroid isomerase-related protein [Pseudomonadota bacterium]
MTPETTRALISQFMKALQNRDIAAALACLSADVIHDVNQGGERRAGRDRFEAYLARMQHHYDEEISDTVVFVSDDGSRGAVEYNLTGIYKQTEDGMPPASGQSYQLPAAFFFAVEGGVFTRVTAYYNLTDWITQVVAAPATLQ